MRKFIGILFICLLLSTQILAQQNVSRLLYGNVYHSNGKVIKYYEDNSTPTTTYNYVNGTYSPGIIKIGRSIQDDSDDGDNVKEYHHYGMGYVEYDLTVDGIGLHVTNATLKVKLYNSANQPSNIYFQAVLLNNNIVSQNKQSQWSTILSASSIGSTGYHNELSINVTNLVNAASPSGKILFGIRASSSTQMYDAIKYATLGYNGSIQKADITAKNNFSGGDIMVGVSEDATEEDSPHGFIANFGATVNLEAVEQSKWGYYRVWNDTEAPNNKSKWDRNGEPRSNYQSHSFTASTSDDNKTYTANLRKRCNITFENIHIGGITGGTIKVNGTNYNSPTSTTHVVEQNNITGGANWHAINGIEYNFDYWSDDGGSSSSHTFTPSYHKNYKAHFIGRPLNSSGSYNRNLQFNSSASNGTPLRVMWKQHPNSNVTKYEIYRKTKYGSPQLIKTVYRTGSSTHNYSYTDHAYNITHNTSSNNLLKYDVRSYYSTEGTVSDVDWRSVYGFENWNITTDDGEIKTANVEEVLEYGMSNFPNPFNPTTTIHYQLPEDANVSIKVFDILGKQVAELVNGTKGVGKHNVMFNSSNLSAGLYIYTIEAKPTNLNGKGFNKTNKMLLVK